MSPSGLRSQLFFERRNVHKTESVSTRFLNILVKCGLERDCHGFKRTTVVVPPQIADLVPVVVLVERSDGPNEFVKSTCFIVVCTFSFAK